MTYRGHIRNGQVAFDEPVQLPEGAAVNVDVMVEGENDRRQILRMPIEQRRKLLMRQSERLTAEYEADPDRTEWQGGDIVE